MSDESEAALASEWLAAAGDPGVAAELRAIHARIARRVEDRGPACWASGRCCNFERVGHRLYATGLEAAFTVLGAGALADIGPRTEDALTRGGCPFQDGRLCGARDVRPIGCRVYFCDRGAADWQRELSETVLADVRALHDRRGITYRYAEWRGLLSMLAAGGSGR